MKSEHNVDELGTIFDGPHKRLRKINSPNMMKEQPRIVVVEDDKMHQKLLVHQLRHIGFNSVEVLSNGAEVTAWLSENSCEIIFTDCQMPIMDGYEMTERIRQREESTDGHLTIIAVTANKIEGNKERCLKAGMDRYIAKPASIASLKEVLQRWIVADIPLSHDSGPLAVQRGQTGLV